MLSDAVLIAFITGLTLVAITFLVTRTLSDLPLDEDDEDLRVGKLLEYSETQLKALNFIVDYIKQSQQPRPPS